MTPTFSRGKLPSDELEKFQLPGWGMGGLA